MKLSHVLMITTILFAVLLNATPLQAGTYYPDRGTFGYDGYRNAHSLFKWSNPGGWSWRARLFVPGYEHDLVVSNRYFTSCTTITSLPASYSDCSTAGIFDHGEYSAFSFGTYRAQKINRNRWYWGAWRFSAGPAWLSKDTQLNGQETTHFICSWDHPWCIDGIRSAVGLIVSPLKWGNALACSWRGWGNYTCSSSTPTTTPSVTSVSPNPLKPLPVSQRQWITIYGKNFTQSSRLEFKIVGGPTYSNRKPVYVSSTQLRYYISVGTTSQDWTVRVSNRGKLSNAYRFSVRNQSPQPNTPVITGVSPNPMPRATDWRRQWLTIYGRNFQPGSKLLFKIVGTSYTYPDRIPTYISSTELRYYISVGPQVYDWTVEVIGPDGKVSNAYGFRVR